MKGSSQAMISRVADHCFWYGRYLERAESTARVLTVTLNLALDGELTPRQCWQPPLIVTGEEAEYARRFGADSEESGERVQELLSWDPESGSSIVRSISAAWENARSIREVISLEAWESTNELYLWIHSDEARSRYRNHRYGFYRRVREGVQLVLGLIRSTMLHDAPLDFIWLGMLLERLGQTARTLDVQYHALTRLEQQNPIVETALWLSLLRACSGFEPFIKTNHSVVTGQRVAAFLMLEPRFPRSVAYCVKSAFERLCAIRPPDDDAAPGGDSLGRLSALKRWVYSLDGDGDALTSRKVHEALTYVVDEVAAICESIGVELLGYGPRPGVALGG